MQDLIEIVHAFLDKGHAPMIYVTRARAPDKRCLMDNALRRIFPKVAVKRALIFDMRGYKFTVQVDVSAHIVFGT